MAADALWRQLHALAAAGSGAWRLKRTLSDNPRRGSAAVLPAAHLPPCPHPRARASCLPEHTAHGRNGLAHSRSLSTARVHQGLTAPPCHVRILPSRARSTLRVAEGGMAEGGPVPRSPPSRSTWLGARRRPRPGRRAVRARESPPPNLQPAACRRQRCCSLPTASARPQLSHHIHSDLPLFRAALLSVVARATFVCLLFFFVCLACGVTFDPDIS